MIVFVLFCFVCCAAVAYALLINKLFVLCMWFAVSVCFVLRLFCVVLCCCCVCLFGFCFACFCERDLVLRCVVVYGVALLFYAPVLVYNCCFVNVLLCVCLFCFMFASVVLCCCFMCFRCSNIFVL